MYGQVLCCPRCDNTPAWQKGLYTPQDDLFYSLVRLLIYQTEHRFGILNPYAAPFYPQEEMNNGQDQMNTNKEISNDTKIHGSKHKKLEKSSKNHKIDHEISNGNENSTTTPSNECNRMWKKPKRPIPNQKVSTRNPTNQREKTNRFKELEETEEDEDGKDTDEDDVWESAEEERRGCDSKVAKSFDVEKMSTEELEEVLANNMDECRKCNETMEAYEGLVCEYHRIAQYAIEQESEAEHLSNVNHYMLVMNYLEMNERKAQRKELAKNIDEHNSFRDEALENGQVIIKAWEDACEKNEKLTTMHDDLVDDYNELLERFQNERKSKECKEYRRNQSRYKSERVYR